MFRIRIAKLFSAGLFTLALTACVSGPTSSGLNNGEDAGDVDASAIGQLNVPDDDQPLAPIAPRNLTPQEEFHNILWGMSLDVDSQRRQWEADRTRQEDLIAYCMNRLGFEYIPFLGWYEMGSGGESELRPDDAEWVAQYGFGWTTNPPQGVGGFLNFFVPGNPNIDTFDSLSEAGQQAFHRALWYRSPDFAREFDDPVNGNCLNWSGAIVQNERQVSRREEFAPLMTAIEAMHVDLRSDISDADRAWSSCMFDAGFPNLNRQ